MLGDCRDESASVTSGVSACENSPHHKNGNHRTNDLPLIHNARSRLTIRAQPRRAKEREQRSGLGGGGGAHRALTNSRDARTDGGEAVRCSTLATFSCDTLNDSELACACAPSLDPRLGITNRENHQLLV